MAQRQCAAPRAGDGAPERCAARKMGVRTGLRRECCIRENKIIIICVEMQRTAIHLHRAGMVRKRNVHIIDPGSPALLERPLIHETPRTAERVGIGRQVPHAVVRNHRRNSIQPHQTRAALREVPSHLHRGIVQEAGRATGIGKGSVNHIHGGVVHATARPVEGAYIHRITLRRPPHKVEVSDVINPIINPATEQIHGKNIERSVADNPATANIRCVVCNEAV